MTTTGSNEAEDWDTVDPEEHRQDEDDISEATRRAVLERDNWRCRKCGEEALEALTLHHVKYRSHGGGHEAENLCTVCWPCHRLIHLKILTVARVMGQWFFSDKRHWRSKLGRSR